MMVPQIHNTSRGPLVKGTGANFPKLSELAVFIEWTRVPVLGRAS